MRGTITLIGGLILAALPWRIGGGGWVEEREIGPYVIRSEFALRDVQDLVDDLTDLQTDLERTLKLECRPQEIQIHLFRSRSGYVNYLSKRVPDGTKRQALFVQGTDAGRVYAYRQKDLNTDVRHETTHALLHTALPYVPIWLDEGIAEYFEVPPGQREKYHPHRRELQRAIFLGWKPSIEKLEAEHKLLDMGANDYRDAWGVIHFILHGPPAAREALAAYFAEVQSGKAPAPLSQHLRRRIPNLEQEIINHLR
jgi:hypothetical protein